MKKDVFAKFWKLEKQATNQSGLFSYFFLLQEQWAHPLDTDRVDPPPFLRGPSLRKLLPQPLQTHQRLLQANQQRVPEHLQIWIKLKRRAQSCRWQKFAWTRLGAPWGSQSLIYEPDTYFQGKIKSCGFVFINFWIGWNISFSFTLWQKV